MSSHLAAGATAGPDLLGGPGGSAGPKSILKYLCLQVKDQSAPVLLLWTAPLMFYTRPAGFNGRNTLIDVEFCRYCGKFERAAQVLAKTDLPR